MSYFQEVQYIVFFTGDFSVTLDFDIANPFIHKMIHIARKSKIITINMRFVHIQSCPSRHQDHQKSISAGINQ